MPRRSPSPRNLALLRLVRAEHAHDLSERQLERWRGWRGVGLILRRPPGTRTRWRPGLADTIPADEVQWVAEAAELVPRCRSLDDVAWQLARRGWPVDGEGLRAVLAASFERLRVLLRSYSSRSAALDRAEARHHRGRGGARRDHMDDVVADLTEPGRIAKAMRAIRTASASDIAEAVRWSATPLEAVDLLAGFLPPSVLERQLVAAGYLAPMSTRAQDAKY